MGTFCVMPNSGESRQAFCSRTCNTHADCQAIDPKMGCAGNADTEGYSTKVCLGGHGCGVEGDQVDGHDIGPHASCCDGLSRLATKTSVGGICQDPPPGSFTCTYCGDGICGLGEDSCICPVDCH